MGVQPTRPQARRGAQSSMVRRSQGPASVERPVAGDGHGGAVRAAVAAGEAAIGLQRDLDRLAALGGAPGAGERVGLREAGGQQGQGEDGGDEAGGHAALRGFMGPTRAVCARMRAAALKRFRARRTAARSRRERRGVDARQVEQRGDAERGAVEHGDAERGLQRRHGRRGRGGWCSRPGWRRASASVARARAAAAMVVGVDRGGGEVVGAAEGADGDGLDALRREAGDMGGAFGGGAGQDQRDAARAAALQPGGGEDRGGGGGAVCLGGEGRDQRAVGGQAEGGAARAVPAHRRDAGMAEQPRGGGVGGRVVGAGGLAAAIGRVGDARGAVVDAGQVAQQRGRGALHHAVRGGQDGADGDARHGRASSGGARNCASAIKRGRGMTRAGTGGDGDGATGTDGTGLCGAHHARHGADRGIAGRPAGAGGAGRWRRPSRPFISTGSIGRSRARRRRRRPRGRG